MNVGLIEFHISDSEQTPGSGGCSRKSLIIVRGSSSTSCVLAVVVSVEIMLLKSFTKPDIIGSILQSVSAFNVRTMAVK